MTSDQLASTLSTPEPTRLTPALANRSENLFNGFSIRAREARLGHVFGSPATLALIFLVAVASFAGSVYLFIIKNSAAWLLLGAVFLLSILFIFAKLVLKKVPVGKNSDDVNDLLSANCLVLLSKDATVTGMAKSLPLKTRSGRFLAARYAITPNLLTAVAKDLQAIYGRDAEEEVFKIAKNLRLELGGPITSNRNSQITQKPQASELQNALPAAPAETVSGGILELALLKAHPNCENILSSMKLSFDDLKDGVVWYNYLHGLVKNAKVKRKTGGIARDLSFGYIPLMSRFGRNISIQSVNPEQVQLEPHVEIVDRMIQTFSSDGRQNVALIGPDGTGKHTIVRSFAWEILSADKRPVKIPGFSSESAAGSSSNFALKSAKIPASLRFRQVFQLDAATILSAAPGRGQVEGLITAILNEAYAAKNIILYFKDAHLFFEDGTGSVDISNLLLPALDNGDLRIILTLDEQKYLEISAKNPALANALNKIMVAPATESETLRVMEDAVPRLEYQFKVTYTIWALKEAYRLSERYVYDLEMPGRALRLLESAANYADHGFVLAESVGQAIEKTQGVKVQVETNEVERARLLNMEDLIHERMIDQVDAVKTVSDALRRSAAGVRNTNRPIGTFLFLGPTGVGKTELAKAVSQIYFGTENDIVRIDLNEYVSADDVARLIAEPTVDPMSLTAQMMKNPFTVVLLDEIEKAHPQVLTTLLQLLDEGILRDSKNHEVSFRDAIVIATSNAGADLIRQAVTGGEFEAVPSDSALNNAPAFTSASTENATFDLAAFRDKLTNHLIDTGEFKPEFLNRFDEICIFKPLGKADLRKIAALLVKGVNKNLAPQKISVNLTDDALDLLVEKGYDPLLGARPMRRVVQKTVENIVAKLVLAGQATPGAEITLTADMVAEKF